MGTLPEIKTDDDDDYYSFIFFGFAFSVTV